MSDKFESHVYLLIIWLIGCILGWFMIPEMQLLGGFVGGNSTVTCAILLEVYGIKH